MMFKTFRIGGIHPEENKITAEIETCVAELPQQAFFPLSQHTGAPAVPIVKRGDKVKVGTKIAEAGGPVSAPVHSSVSGTVTKIGAIIDATGYNKPVIIIKTEGDEWEESIDRSDALETLDGHDGLTPEYIITRIRDAGITGMGGAGFPTYVKLTPPSTSKIDCVIINAVECEPYITSDYRLMMEHADEILVGVKLVLMAVSAPVAYIGIERNKPAAIRLFQEKTIGERSIKVVPLEQKYPQGGEKQLIDAVTRRQVPDPPAIPANVGTVVVNVGTAFAVYQAVMKNKPLFERYTSVSGKHISQPKNFLVRMGTPISQLIDACGGLPDGDNKIIAGGPMMGKALMTTGVPVCKGTNSITVLSGKEAVRDGAIGPCIRCAKCVGVCPMGLEPYILATSSAAHNWEMAEEHFITSCIECGSCQYTCPANRPMLDNIRFGKSKVMTIIRARKQKS